MTWFKVDDYMHAHPKVLAAGNAAIGLWVRTGSWSAQQLTNGHIPTSLARQYGRPRDIKALIDAGLWSATKDGYLFHDWDDFQPTAEQSQRLRSKRSEAGRKGAARRWGAPTGGSPPAVANGAANAMAEPWQNDAPSPSRPVVGVDVVSHSPAVTREPPQTDDGLDLDTIAQALHSDRPWAARVGHDVLARAGPVTRPTAYVLSAISAEPGRYQPTRVPPRPDQLCDHGRDAATCPHCAEGETP